MGGPLPEPTFVFDDKKAIQRMRPMLQRVLIVDPQPERASLIDGLMRSIAGSQVWMAVRAHKALKLAGSCEPDLVFVELRDEALDGADFTRQLRRSALGCRQAALVMTTLQASATAVLAARDAGAHELLRRPFTEGDLLRCLEAVMLRPRDWVEAVSYVGPDRRQFGYGDYSGPLKRGADSQAVSDAARIAQALKILRSVIQAVESDPEQAMRALLAQAEDLHAAATGISDVKLAADAAAFRHYLILAARPLSRAEAERRAAALLSYTPRGFGGRSFVAA